MPRIRARPVFAALRIAQCAWIACAAAGAAAAEPDFVGILGGALRAGDRPAAFSCAAGVRLPSPGSAAGTNALDDARAAARGLARDLALAGFGMVRLPDLAVPRTGDPAAEERLAVQDEFVAACKDEGLRVWAEVLHPVCDFVPSPADADALDDPATRDAWREAVADTNCPASSILLAAAWDPRLEILVQRRMRDWARAFNPRTGLRRCDDPVYAIFSFSSLWWDDMNVAALPAFPPFFERELLDAWNDWLWERRGTDQALRDLFGLDPGETLVSNSVAFPPPERDPSSLRSREQRIFLHWLSVLHLSRLLTPFSSFGRTSRTAPRIVRHGGPNPFLRRLSTAALFEPPAGDATDAPAESSMPLVWDASLGPDPGGAVATAARAAAAGADVLVLPCGSDPAAWAAAAAAFPAGRAAPAALETASRTRFYDFPAAAHARLDVPGPGGEPSVAEFPSAGAAVAVACVPAGTDPVFPAALAAWPRQFLVCFRADGEAAAERAAEEGNAFPEPAEDAQSAGNAEAADAAETAGNADAAQTAAAEADPSAPVRRRSPVDVTLLFPSSRPGYCILHVRSSGEGDDGPFAFSARGRELARKECLPGGVPPAVLPESGLFRVEGASAPASFLFRPAAPGPGILRDL